MESSNQRRSQKQSKRVLVTGGLGFIGSAFLRLFVPLHPEYDFINVDDQRAGSNPAAVDSVVGLPNYHYYKIAIENAKELQTVFRDHEITDIIHFAAETDVDRSIRQPMAYTNEANVASTINLLEQVGERGKPWGKRFVYVSTDEVYGPAPEWQGDLDTQQVLEPPPPFMGFLERDRLRPTNPYSASKAAAEHYTMACHNTYNCDVVITRGSNTFGPYQDYTKLIPVSVRSLRLGGKIPLYGDGMQVREWLPVDDHARGIYHVWLNGKSGEAYNISTGVSFPNMHMASMLIDAVGAPEDSYHFVEDRPGHDRKYSIDNRKLRRLGWKPPTNEEVMEQIRETARWYYAQKDD